MTRMSKQGERRAVSPRTRRVAAAKTGPKRDRLEFGYRPHENAAVSAEGEATSKQAILQRFIPKVPSKR